MPAARAASTLLLVHPGTDGELVVPLTLRHAALRAHAGEVSLPGGAVDPGDATREAAALREAWAEIGLQPASVRVAGVLDDIWIPVTNFELRPYVGDSSLFIVPGFRFHVVDAMLTNFHLPESTLLMLVSAFAGQEAVLSAYRHAVAQGYRFFSYGDAMLVHPAPGAHG